MIWVVVGLSVVVYVVVLVFLLVGFKKLDFCEVNKRRVKSM